ncbi:signal transduction histidine kinase [Dysgonomonas alginatilytica]|uniref:histidine kinase n=1 Tax=Dysgonomonas alginatilytica TaxID=1605892 RepID=A0A2V3PVG0_9BACT|nr:HAMP domain-containing sensor histidine kinase [Dysgonomonas alginatilytica]PXV68078.1 signal transduction histidine kinase [Dysgonomonas alginatilytica]
MKVQTRLSLFCSIVFGVIFAILSLLIYALYYNNVEKSIYQGLQKTVQITALFYLEEDELSSRDFAKIRKQFEEAVSDSYYQIYNEENKVSYGAKPADIPINILDRIRKEKQLSFSTDEFLCNGIFYEDNQGDFVVITKKKKEYLNEQMNQLLWVLLAALIIGLLTIIGLSRWVSHVAYRPFRRIINQVNNISTKNLDVQIESPQTKDELQDLTDTFNVLLDKLSETFIIQKNFVNYVSHEFKTPLASILGNLEVFSIKDRTAEEYKQLSDKLIQQIYQLEEILNILIVISDLREDSDIRAQVRIDDLIWEIISKISDRYPDSKIKVDVDILPEDEQLLSVSKDKTQLLMAMFNLIENAVKYSQGNIVDIHLSKTEGNLSMSITDKGIGIPSDQLANISKPFYRADNTNKIQGSGIGLSIALRILEKNKIKYEIVSEENKGTCIILILPRI